MGRLGGGPGPLQLNDLAAPAASGTTRPTGPRAAIPTSATAAPSLGLGSGFVDDEIAIAKQPTIQHLDRLGGLLFRGHLDESETTGTPRELVGDDPDALDGTRLLKEFAKVFLCGLKRQVTDEEL